MKCLVFSSAVVLAMALAGCRPEPTSEEGSRAVLIVAAAANLTDVFSQIAPEFEAQSGIHLVPSFASTAQLAQQIENSAPFDVFLAADAQHVDDLDRKGLLVPGTKAVYARGVLALWIPAENSSVKSIQNLTRPEIRTIAIAKPELAPYGQAAVESLEKSGLWPRLEPKVVYAENISMAKQYGTSKNADAVFTAYSLVLHESGTVIQVDGALHHPIDQEIGVLKSSTHQADARRFVNYLLGEKGKVLLASFGYETTVPATASAR